MTERDDRVWFSASSDVDERTHANQLRHSGASSTSANTPPLSGENVHQGASPLASAAEMIAGQQQHPVDLRPQDKSPDQHSSGSGFRRDAGSSREMHGARTTAAPSPPSQQEETEPVLASTIANQPPGPLQEIVNEEAAHLTGAIATPCRQSSELGITGCAGSSKEIPASAMTHPAGNEDDDGYRDEHEHSEGSDGNANEDFEYGGEQEDREESTERSETNMQRKEEDPEASEGVAQETKQADVDEGEKKGAASAGTTTHSVPCDNRSSQHIALNALTLPSTPAGGVAQALEQSPQDEHASAVALSQQQDCLEAKEDGEKHDHSQAPHSALIPAGSNTETTSDTRVVGSSIAEPLPGTEPDTAATDEPNGEIGIENSPEYVRRPSYIAGQAMGPGRSVARASVQLSLPPMTESGPETDYARAASTDIAIKIIRAASEVEPEEPGQLAGYQSWAEYHQQNSKRQHSTPNLVKFRKNARRPAVELFEESDSDDTSTSRSSSGDVGEEDANVKRQRQISEAEEVVSWKQSEEGISRMVQLTKATVAVESTAVSMSKKYLKLFAPSNSVRLVVFACVSCKQPSPLPLFSIKEHICESPKVKRVFSIYICPRALKLIHLSHPVQLCSIVRTEAICVVVVGSATPKKAPWGTGFAQSRSRCEKAAFARRQLGTYKQHRRRCVVPFSVPAYHQQEFISADTTLPVGFFTCCIQGSRHLQSTGSRAPKNERDRLAAKGGLGFVPCSSVSDGAG